LPCRAAPQTTPISDTAARAHFLPESHRARSNLRPIIESHFQRCAIGQLASPLRILVVDDNADATELIAEFMALHGHQVATANGGAQAIATAEAFEPNLIFLDIGMPGVDGYQVAATLRHAARLPPARIVALTAWGDAVSRARAVACGFDAHLVKPARLERLIDQAELAIAAR
jgi:CheY-like chemotaxis protein